MGQVRVNDDFYPFSLQRMFEQDRGFSMMLEFHSGVMPTKADIEAADIYMDDDSGWIDPAKWATYTSSFPLVRRWWLNDFSKNITPLDATRIRFGFSDRPNNDYQESNDAQNVFNAGDANWFVFRSMPSNSTLIHYLFTGTISLLAGTGDMKIVRQTLTTTDFVIPDSVVVNLGALSVP